jgi:threonylcarbamoyladenosine tRNA methylthiotransferase MtaB
MFPYSEREGTPAARMPQVEKSIRKERAKILRQDGNKELLKFFNQNLGLRTSILIEGNQKSHTENFIPVKLQGEKVESSKVGHIVLAKLVGIEEDYMIGELLK